MVSIQDPSKSKLYPTEIVDGVRITDTTDRKGNGGRIHPWKGSIPAEFKRAEPETPKMTVRLIK
jgi:hypothetical protein